MTRTTPFSWMQALQNGFIAGLAAILIALIGMVAAFAGRDVIFNVITMGQIFFLAPLFVFGYVTALKGKENPKGKIALLGALTGLTGGLVIAILILIGQEVNLRTVLINASPQLYRILAFDRDLPAGVWAPILIGAISGGLGSLVYLLPASLRKGVLMSLVWILLLGLLRELLIIMIGQWGPLEPLFRWMFALRGLTLEGAIFIFLLVTGLTYLRSKYSVSEKIASVVPIKMKIKPQVRRGAIFAFFVVLVLLLPGIIGRYPTEVLDNVGIFIILGLGLNILIGYAGILNLGFVAFFAIGAYAMGVLTSPELGFFSLTYWQALPIVIVISALVGTILGLPVLKTRGDYIAIVTLGFGEIIRLLVLSDWLRPWLGGSTGIQQIARPQVGNIVLATQEQLYYLILAGVVVTAFIAWRLKDSRLGRAWNAMREDEDVAQAMGINKVQIKILAFTVGGTLAGISGTIFAAKLTSVYPHSFNLLISINTLCLLIVGGMGSIPGVFVGALALYGIPELLREFNEFRLLIYGAVLVGMMLLKPEGLWPEARQKLELHEEEADVIEEVKRKLEGGDAAVPVSNPSTHIAANNPIEPPTDPAGTGN
jgi:branched-chain amino acid transport system permease protein